MRKSMTMFVLLVSLLFSSLFVNITRVDAQARTAVTISFKEANDSIPLPKENENLPLTQATEIRKGGFTSDLSDAKRLPVTGEEYNQTLIKLGWLMLFAGIFFYLIGKLGKEKYDAEI
ncbi:hypothetical protein [Enterococcus sp. DIV0756]|uniref:hypothetical protein n=1 Tax=Enterococcus sp. DIV0756 TaxID=2774636 RepID=UPI003F22A71C